MKGAESLWPKLRSRLARGRGTLFILDFDGTLARLVDHPARARLSRPMRDALTRLARRPDVHLAVLSGRRLADVRRRVGVPGLTYAGNHGAEIAGPRVVRRPLLAEERKAVREAARRLTRAVAGVDGAWVERKGLGVVVHHRKVAARDLPKLRRRVRGAWRGLRSPLGWAEGHRIWEMRPGGLWNKGHAALHIWRAEGRPAVVAVGDDRTDEDMFAALPARALTVRVGRPAATAASCAVGSPADVEILLGRAARFLERRRS